MKNRKYILPEEGRFYKANLHSHTTLSDGHLTPEESKAAYQARGYQIMAFTDHRVYRDHSSLNDRDFLTIPAVEVDINEDCPERMSPTDRTYHINLFDTKPEYKKEEKEKGICPECRYGDMEYINNYIREMNEMGFLVCYNHPYWSMQTLDDFRGLEGLFAMEIFNYGCEHDGMYGYNPQAYDEMLRRGKRIFCLATDDNHNSVPLDHPFSDSFGGFTMIKATELTLEAVMDALKKGNFYSSMGPEIREMYIEDDELVVRTGPVRRIYVVTAGRDCLRKAAAPGEVLQEARFPLSGREGYIRVRIEDGQGKYADSNAYFL